MKEKLQQFYSGWKGTRNDVFFFSVISKDATIDHPFDSIFHFIHHQLCWHPTIPYFLHQEPYLKNQNENPHLKWRSDHNTIPFRKIQKHNILKVSAKSSSTQMSLLIDLKSFEPKREKRKGIILKFEIKTIILRGSSVG